jgi:hypothetical protein
MSEDVSQDADVERELARIDEGGNAWEDTEAAQLTVRRPLDKVVPVRLPSEMWDELRREAQQLGLGPSTLVRMWVLEKLRDTQRAKPSA